MNPFGRVRDQIQQKISWRLQTCSSSGLSGGRGDELRFPTVEKGIKPTESTEFAALSIRIVVHNTLLTLLG